MQSQPKEKGDENSTIDYTLKDLFCQSLEKNNPFYHNQISQPTITPQQYYLHRKHLRRKSSMLQRQRFRI